MLSRPFAGFLVKAIDVGLELVAVHSPDASTADLDRRQLSGTDERVCLRDAHGKIGRHIFERHEARLHARFLSLRARFVAHLQKIAVGDDGYLALEPFALVCPRTGV